MQVRYFRCENGSRHKINKVHILDYTRNPTTFKLSLIHCLSYTQKGQFFTYNIEKSQQLTEEVSVSPPIVVLQIVVQIVQQKLFFLLLFHLAHHPHVEIHHEGSDFSCLPILPEPPWNVEKDWLKHSVIKIKKIV